MPTYQYHCEACKTDFEVFHGFNDAPPKACPSCKKKKITKVISGGAGIVFKGGGFYETDYKRGQGSDYKSKADSDSGSPAAKTEAKADAPAAKTDAAPAKEPKAAEKPAAAPAKPAKAEKKAAS